MNRYALSVAIVAIAVATRMFAAAAAVTSPPPSPPAPTSASAAPPPVRLTSEEVQFFEAKIRPIFVSKCYKCHSMDGKAKGGLVLDSRDGWMKGGKGGSVIEPGNAAKSRLILAIGFKDPDLQMPPKGDKLTDSQIADLTKWVNEGAADPRDLGAGGIAKLSGLTNAARAHWAYQPIKVPPIPDVKDKAWVRTPVDSFILAKLEENNLKPNKAAAKEALLRRAYYDLVGLPPAPEELAAFLRDHSPNAFEKVVDSLLASPHYGERWGRFWLDSARYGDTTGYLGQTSKDYRYAYAWTYRDWVIQSFNQDKPYDRFLMEQLAADALPEAKEQPEILAALGFLTVGKRFPNENDTIDERIDTISKAMLGMTVACARCHDHKFDPIPQMDYYSLHGILSSVVEPDEKPLISDTKRMSSADYAAYQKKLKALEDKNREIYFTMLDKQGTEFRKKAAAYILSKSLFYKTEVVNLKLRAETNKQNDLSGPMLESLHLRGPLFAPLEWFSKLSPDDWTDYTKVKACLDDIASGRKVIENPVLRDAFKTATPATIHSMKDIADVYGKLFTSLQPKADEYIKACREAQTTTVAGWDKSLIELLCVPCPIEPSPLITTEHIQKVLLSEMAMRSSVAFSTFMFSAINELEMLNPAAPAYAMAVVDVPKPHDDPLFIRGEAATHGPIAPRRFLEILSPKDRELFKIGSGRLELARNIASKTNPMTPRIMVNRIWMHHFGEGFVRTPDDLGVQSEPPSHRELIDYLSARFMEDGWSIKKMHKLIMLSNAYQQSVENNPAYAIKDPANRLLWRANLRRLDFEAIRDTVLLFTGNLDASIGGRPVNLTDEPYSYRRSIYGYIDRGDLPDLMLQFDFSDPDRPNSRRISTIVPQQALFFMNSPMSADVARKVTARPEFVSAGTDHARVRALYLVLFQREPRASEIALAAQFFNSHDASKVKLMNSPASHTKATGTAKIKNEVRGVIQNQGERVERAPLTLWQQYAQALLFTNEIAYVN